LGNAKYRIMSQLLGEKMSRASLLLIVAIAFLAITPQWSAAQFVPCKIVNLNVVPPTLVQGGQSFEVTTDMTVSCDPSVLPIIRIDLVDATTSQTLSTSSVPYYSYSSSFTASVVNQATARQIIGSWALRVQVYVINGLNGQSVASTGQLFQVNVEPYTPPTQMQTVITQFSNSSFAVSTSSLSAPTEFENSTQTAMSSVLVINTQMASSSNNQLLVPTGILLVGFVVFGLLMFAASRRKR